MGYGQTWSTEKEQNDRGDQKACRGRSCWRKAKYEGDKWRVNSIECIGGGRKTRQGRSRRNEAIPCADIDFDARKRRAGTEL
jgi:hypothetical protein